MDEKKIQDKACTTGLIVSLISFPILYLLYWLTDFTKLMQFWVVIAMFSVPICYIIISYVKQKKGDFLNTD